MEIHVSSSSSSSSDEEENEDGNQKEGQRGMILASTFTTYTDQTGEWAPGSGGACVCKPTAALWFRRRRLGSDPDRSVRQRAVPIRSRHLPDLHRLGQEDAGGEWRTPSADHQTTSSAPSHLSLRLQVWSCGGCFSLFHLPCIQKWARDSVFLVSSVTDEDFGQRDHPWPW